jgi:NADH dehydrogenase
MAQFQSDAPIAAVIGGSGFIGRYVVQALARRGWRVRAGCRRPNEAGFVRMYGVVGQVEPVQVNVRDDASTAAAMEGAEAAVYSVGVLYNSGRNTFEAVQAEGPARAAKAAKAAGVPRFVLISAIGADAESKAAYARTKAEGEAAVLAEYPDAVILRPSIVFGPEDQFFNRFAGMARS